MINGRLSDKLEGCLEFLEFGRHGRALDFNKDISFHYGRNSTTELKANHAKYSSKRNQREKRTRNKMKALACNCEYVCVSQFKIIYLSIIDKQRVSYLMSHYRCLKISGSMEENHIFFWFPEANGQNAIEDIDHAIDSTQE